MGTFTGVTSSTSLPTIALTNEVGVPAAIAPFTRRMPRIELDAVKWLLVAIRVSVLRKSELNDVS